ncbi:hypothetical protein [Paraburkholderia saeva]|uniref:Uncharacterized protein n=1 Tax=Paraburkholderia saeva TaxID=2777537 RepID=A0A9N8RYJ3_9BURK|nr:hypothetical protein [Paraburkholderia saeva]CAG4889989.1 hypothetical protein R70241_00875 [Paraburkholderia saeva]CAG4912773.1 hypothetical protein LMG31841_04202 [Paraburkholderia saeva]
MCAICNFKIEFGVGHPLALSVAVETRKAIESGLVEPVESAEGALSAARMRMSAVETLNLLQARIEGAHGEDALLALPDFYVLLIENDTWGFFHATTNGFDPDVVPEMPDLVTTDEARRSNIIVTSEAGLRAWLDGKFDTEAALRDSLFMIDASRTCAASLTKMLAVAEPAEVGN